MFNQLLLIVALLLLCATVFGKIANNIGLPALLLFILVGVCARFLGITFYNYELAQDIGIIAIFYILFMGGLSINVEKLKLIFTDGILLATFGVFITAIITGVGAFYILHLPFLQSLLLGSILSSTDAAAVFSVLRSNKIGLREDLKLLLEFESGSNDPMAVFLTLGAMGLIANEFSATFLFFNFFKQMFFGIVFGYCIAKATVWLINRIKFEYDGLYAVITISIVLFTYSVISLLGGNGFIGVYVCGLTMASLRFVNKKNLLKFHDAFAWIMQILMFLILGLLVDIDWKFFFPSVLIAGILIFVARPIAVFLISRRSFNDNILISWVGLRGAAPIVLAIFPLTANIQYANEIFNLIFFVVIISVLLQGSTIAFLVKLLKLNEPFDNLHKSILEYDGTHTNNKMIEFTIPDNAKIIGQKVLSLNLPEGSITSLIYKNGVYIVPTSSTIIEACDVLFILLDIKNEQLVRKIICKEE